MAADVPCCEPMFWLYLMMCVGLVSFAGLMSGLTLGLMSLSLVDLEVLVHAGRPQDRKNAAKILPIVKNQHLLLCTLLIGNAMAMEALPIFLDALLPAWGAILISVTLILAFGEIIPQSVCSRYGLAVGAKLSIVVRVIVILLFPIAYPISKLLDLLLGKRHSALLRRDELKMLVNMHGNEAGKGGELTHDETTIIAGALDMTLKTVRDAMTPISKVFSLDISSRLDEKTMGLIISKGHSRVLIYSGESTNIVGLILVKNLIKYSPEDQTLIGDLSIRRIPRVHDCLPLYDMLNQFQKGHSHMAVVVKSKASFGEKLQQEDAKGKYGQFNSHLSSPSVNSHNSINIHCSVVQNEVDPNNNDNNKKMNSQLLNNWERRNGYFSKEELESLPNLEEEVIGIITLEDVMEELLQEEILDETDEYIEAHNRIKINMLTSSPGSVHVSPSYWIGTPLASSPISSCHQTPLSSYDHTPILRSPFSPYIQSPLIARPSLCASPGIPIGNHPRIFPGSHRRSG